MRIHLSDFPAAEGLHCSSTSVRVALAYDGIAISEAAAFGLGSGLGCFYLEREVGSPSLVLNGRAPDLEGAFYRHAGSPLEWAGRWDEAAMAALLTGGRPVLAQTDLYYLPYYQPPVHFPGHGVVIVGLDREGGVVEIADQGFPEPQKTSLESMRRAMEVVAPPLLVSPFRWAGAPRLTRGEVGAADAVEAALRRTVRVMQGDEDGTLGLPAVHRLAERLPAWSDAVDFEWCARFAYQSIEKRGTGGGAFRYLYAAFLREAATRFAPLGASDAAELYEEAGDGWRELARGFKAVLAGRDPALFARCAERARRILAVEERACRSLKRVLA